jgi:biotin carboxylase
VQQKPILVLGGGRHQISLIKSIQAAGYPVLLSDYLKHSPGHEIAQIPTLTDTLDSQANIELARKFDIQGVITTGTDQPLVVMADVAQNVGIPCYLTPESSRSCTDKARMFEVLSEAGIKIPKYSIVDNTVRLLAMSAGMEFPLVVKPCDSQGQRGITIAHDRQCLLESAELAWQESSSKDIIIQEFTRGPEMTISAWVSRGHPQIMLITDRVTYNRPPATGVCLQHIYPSLHIKGLEDLAAEFVQQIAQAYSIQEGPMYIQCVRSNDDLFLIEATCRIGGGHEERLIELVTGVDVHQHLLALAVQGRSESFPRLANYPVPDCFAMVNFVVAKPGVFGQTKEPGPTADNPYGGFYYGSGHQQGIIVNSMGRVGYFVCRGATRKTLMSSATLIYKKFSAISENGDNLVFWPDSEHLNQ